MSDITSKRNKRVVVYLSDDEFKNEYKELRAKLVAKGTNFSDWVRRIIIKESKV